MKTSPTTLTALAFSLLAIVSTTAKNFDVEWGDVLDVPNGHYRLTGDLSGPFGETAITITADHVVLDLNGYCITSVLEENPARPGHYLTSPTHIGILVKNASNVQIRKGCITGFSFAIQFENVANSHIRDCVIGENFRGVWLRNGSVQNHIRNNLIVDHECCGIRLDASHHNKIQGNVCTANNEGIHVQGDANEVRHNNADANRLIGIWVFRGADNVVRENTANDNGGLGRVQGGIVLGLPAAFGGPLFATGTLVMNNTALGNAGSDPSSPFYTFQIDLWDTSLPACDNTWKKNTFVRDNETGGNYGPGTGCIQ